MIDINKQEHLEFSRCILNDTVSYYNYIKDIKGPNYSYAAKWFTFIFENYQLVEIVPDHNSIYFNELLKIVTIMKKMLKLKSFI